MEFPDAGVGTWTVLGTPRSHRGDPVADGAHVVAFAGGERGSRVLVIRCVFLRWALLSLGAHRGPRDQAPEDDPGRHGGRDDRGVIYAATRE